MKKKGDFPWPVQGAIISNYGLKLNKEFQYRVWQKAIKIRTKSNAKVYSVHNGKVIFSGYVTGFGKTLVLDHKDHFYTVYSNLSKIVVKKYDIIKANQTIANAGFFKNEKANGIEFSVRHYSQAKDPLNWIRKKTVAKRGI